MKIIRKLPFKAAIVKKNLDFTESLQREDRQMERIRDLTRRYSLMLTVMNK